MSELTRLHAHRLSAGLRAGDFSARDLIDAHLAEIEATDRPLHAWVHVDADGARAQADEADRRLREEGERAPALLGLPVALKDLVLTRGDVSVRDIKIVGDKSSR